MRLEDAIETLTGWLDVTHVESAPARIAEMRERNFQKDAGALGTYCGSLERISMHEAAHAVAAIRSGFPVTRVCIRADGSGSVEHGSQTQDQDDDISAMIPKVIFDLAGISCELILGVDARRESVLQHSYDVLQAGMRIKVCRERLPDWTLTSRTFASMACSAVQSNWRSIERLATALHALRDLNGDEVRALCGGADG